METLIRTAHSDMTIGELSKSIERQSRPVKRSPHVGNIEPKDLAVMLGLPEGIEVIMVDTIQGDDKVAKPTVALTGNGGEVTLASKNSARSRVVGSVAITSVEMADQLSIRPEIGQSLSQYHTKALLSLPLRNMPAMMMNHFHTHADLLEAVAQSCIEDGCLHRVVGPNGKITSNTIPDLARDGLCGVNGTTPLEVGALLPLPGMMAMDILMSERAGSDQTLHLAGGDMTKYTRDGALMDKVSRVKARAAALMGIQVARHTFIVQDCRGLAAAVPFVSQHEVLLRNGVIDLTPFMSKPAGVEDGI